MSSAAEAPDPRSSRGLAQALRGVRTALAGLAEQPLWAVPGPALLDALADLTMLQASLDAVRLSVVAEIEQRGAAAEAGAPSTSAWLRGALRLAPGAAASQARLADRLTRPAYAPTARALAAGTISTAHATVVARTLDSLGDPVDADALDEAQQSLLEQASRLDPTQLRHAALHLRAVLDPTSLDELARRELDQAEHRTLTPSPAGDGWVLVRGQLDTEGAAQLGAAISALAAPRPSADEGPDPRLATTRRADALVELARRALAAGGLPTTHGGQRPCVVVTTSLDTLRDQLGTALLDGTAGLGRDAPMTPGAARRLACDARLIPAVLGSSSQPLDLGRSTRAVSPALYRALVLRDRGGAFPHCDRPPGWTEAHHVQHWADGGATALENLILLCAHHHRVVHARSWHIDVDPEGRPRVRPG